MRYLTGFSQLPEILATAESVKLLPLTGRYSIDADQEKVSNYMTELQAMGAVINNGLAALNFCLIDLSDEAEISKNQLVDLLMLQTGLNELNHVISEAAHAIGMATPKEGAE